MARYEKDLEAADDAPDALVEWIAGLAEKEAAARSESHGAKVARLLSGIDRGETLGGAFSAAGLTKDKGK